MFDIREDDLTGRAQRSLLELHLRGMQADSPPGMCFALDLSGLTAPGVTVWSAWAGDDLAAIGALKQHSPDLGEIKSMRADPEWRGRGAGAAILDHILAEARARGLSRVSLETGTGAAFAAAEGLYRSRGFAPGGPFADYAANGFNQFLHLRL